MLKGENQRLVSELEGLKKHAQEQPASELSGGLITKIDQIIVSNVELNITMNAIAHEIAGMKESMI